MKPSDHCKAVGLKGLKELSELVQWNEQTLRSWHESKPELFQKALDMAVEKKALRDK